VDVQGYPQIPGPASQARRPDQHPLRQKACKRPSSSGVPDAGVLGANTQCVECMPLLRALCGRTGLAGAGPRCRHASKRGGQGRAARPCRRQPRRGDLDRSNDGAIMRASPAACCVDHGSFADPLGRTSAETVPRNRRDEARQRPAHRRLRGWQEAVQDRRDAYVRPGHRPSRRRPRDPIAGFLSCRWNRPATVCVKRPERSSGAPGPQQPLVVNSSAGIAPGVDAARAI
jgi:hypothetical protein